MSLMYHDIDLLPIVKRVIPEIRDDAILVVTNMPTFHYPADPHPWESRHQRSATNSVDLKTYEVPRADGTIIQFTGALIDIDLYQYFVLLETITHVAMQLIAYDNDREAS